MRTTVAALAGAALATAASADGVTPPEAVQMTADRTIEQPLTPEPGDGYRGVQLFIDESRAMCTTCHYNADVAGTGQSGNVGPVLSLIGDKNSEGRLRAIMVNAPAVLGEDVPMPAYYVPDADGETMLSAQEIEDIVAYLMELHRHLD